MSKVKQEMEARCELAMMGKVVEVHSNNEVQPMVEYILGVLNIPCEGIFDESEGAFKMHIANIKSHNVKYLVVNTLMGTMRCITFLLESTSPVDSNNHYPAPFETDYGTGLPCAFCYVLNLDADWASEFGDCFFCKRGDGYYHRVG